MNRDIFSVGPPHALEIGLTAVGVLCIFLRKYSCCVRGMLSGLKLRKSLVMLSITPFLYMLWTRSLMASARGMVGSVSIFL